jgi:hypothetical protein
MEPEIEITPAMIEAAYLVLSEYALDNGAYDLRPPALAALYRAMVLASPRQE